MNNSRTFAITVMWTE